MWGLILHSKLIINIVSKYICAKNIRNYQQFKTFECFCHDLCSTRTLLSRHSIPQRHTCTTLPYFNALPTEQWADSKVSLDAVRCFHLHLSCNCLILYLVLQRSWAKLLGNANRWHTVSLMSAVIVCTLFHHILEADFTTPLQKPLSPYHAWAWYILYNIKWILNHSIIILEAIKIGF